MCFEFSLCLSRACLGKIIVFILQWRKNGASLPLIRRPTYVEAAVVEHQRAWRVLQLHDLALRRPRSDERPVCKDPGLAMRV